MSCVTPPHSLEIPLGHFSLCTGHMSKMLAFCPVTHLSPLPSVLLHVVPRCRGQTHLGPLHIISLPLRYDNFSCSFSPGSHCNDSLTSSCPPVHWNHHRFCPHVFLVCFHCMTILKAFRCKHLQLSCFALFLLPGETISWLDPVLALSTLEPELLNFAGENLTPSVWMEFVSGGWAQASTSHSFSAAARWR